MRVSCHRNISQGAGAWRVGIRVSRIGSSDWCPGVRLSRGTIRPFPWAAQIYHGSIPSGREVSSARVVRSVYGHSGANDLDTNSEGLGFIVVRRGRPAVVLTEERVFVYR